MSFITTKVNLDELPEVLVERVNFYIKDDFIVLDIEKVERTSKRTGKTNYDYSVRLKNRGLFIQLELTVYSHLEPVEKDTHLSMVTASDILFFIKNDEYLHSRVTKFINEG